MYTAYVTPCANPGAQWETRTRSYPKDLTCEKRPDWNGPYTNLTGGKPRNGSVTCNAGCRQAWYSTGDGYFTGKYTSVPGTCNDYDDQKCKAEFGSGYSWNQGMSTCEPDDGKCPDGSPTNSLGQCKPEPCPAGKVQQADGTCKNKENECPAGQIKSPDGKCLPGEGQCAKGEAKGKDGTCKKDADENGTPDEEESDPSEPGEPGETPAEEFTGGDNCTQPPTCSGSPVMCGQARIQWRIDCNTRKNRTIAGGMCSTPPVCTGEKCDAMEYNSLLMQWRTACATEKLAAATGTGTGSNPDLVAIRNALTGTGGTVDPGTSLPGSGAWQGGQGTDPIQPDTSGYGWGGGSCPAIPAIDVMGATIQFDPAPLCNWLSLGSYFVMGLAALASLRIVAT
ncbi:hypothetical protein, partial [Stenotrophomonas sp. GbtcB23]|uniref:hypothetical protein n=1 Tax=Stenotrophomonas sp. GbtcB23 TaxID=2824768 RepID=UPI001C2F5FB0